MAAERIVAEGIDGKPVIDQIAKGIYGRHERKKNTESCGVVNPPQV